MMLDLDSHYHVSNIMNTFISEMESVRYYEFEFAQKFEGMKMLFL